MVSSCVSGLWWPRARAVLRSKAARLVLAAWVRAGWGEGAVMVVLSQLTLGQGDALLLVVLVFLGSKSLRFASAAFGARFWG